MVRRLVSPRSASRRDFDAASRSQGLGGGPLRAGTRRKRPFKEGRVRQAGASRKSLLVVLSAPSGGGKTTIADRLLSRDRRLVRSVSCTTRRPRPGERHGRDYFFLTPARFERLRRAGEFLEWARVHGKLYGTPRQWVERQLARGRDVLFVIDVQGGRQIKRQFPDAVQIFLMPPDLRELRRRLAERGSEKPGDLARRLRNARREIRVGKSYDHRVVNDRLERATREVLRLLRWERRRRQKTRD